MPLDAEDVPLLAGGNQNSQPDPVSSECLDDLYFEANSTNKNATGKLSYRKTQEFPIRLISANGGTYEFDAMPKQEPPPFDVVLKWRDGEGDHGRDRHVSLEYQT